MIFSNYYLIRMGTSCSTCSVAAFKKKLDPFTLAVLKCCDKALHVNKWADNPELKGFDEKRHMQMLRGLVSAVQKNHNSHNRMNGRGLRTRMFHL